MVMGSRGVSGAPERMPWLGVEGCLRAGQRARLTDTERLVSVARTLIGRGLGALAPDRFLLSFEEKLQLLGKN
jgi:hypothetical protein